jgi:hypothetical protein
LRTRKRNRFSSPGFVSPAVIVVAHHVADAFRDGAKRLGRGQPSAALDRFAFHLLLDVRHAPRNSSRFELTMQKTSPAQQDSRFIASSSTLVE